MTGAVKLRMRCSGIVKATITCPSLPQQPLMLRKPRNPNLHPPAHLRIQLIYVINFPQQV